MLERGTARRYTATALSPSGDTLDIPLVWRSTDESIAIFERGGVLVAKSPGGVGIFASALGVTSAPVGVQVVWLGPARIIRLPFAQPNAATPGFTLQDSLRVQVLNPAGQLVPDARVRFTITEGGGSVSSTIDTTDALGRAAVAWTLGPSAGLNTVSVAVIDSAGNPMTWVTDSPVTFTVRSYQALEKVAGDAQTGQILSELPIAPAIRVLDSTGTPRAGVPVTFTASSGGRVETVLVSTDAMGVASPGSWTLGDEPGAQTLTASLESARITLSATATGTPIHYLPAQVFAGASATCALHTDARVECWGETPQNGYDSTAFHTPLPVKGDLRFVTMSAGAGFATAQTGPTGHFCGIVADASIYCWGVNALVDTSGQIFNTRVPTRLASDITWRSVAPGAGHNCAIATDDLTYCWGTNATGQLGDGRTTNRFVPAPISGGFRFTRLAAGQFHNCGLTVEGAVFCWGLNQGGQLGDGTGITRFTPTAVLTSTAFQAIGAGEAITCGLSTAGVAHCWGAIASPVRPTPTPYPGLPPFTSLSVGGAHACALTADGTAYCWGNNQFGQLGDSTTTSRTAPVKVAGSLRFQQISTGYIHTCGITVAGAVACWGANRAGELGDNTTTIRLVPRHIVLGVRE